MIISDFLFLAFFFLLLYFIKEILSLRIIIDKK